MGVSWPRPKVISPRSRSKCTHTQNQCPGHYSSLQRSIWIIFYTFIVRDPKICHDLDLRSHRQGHSARIHIPKIRVGAITPNCHVGSRSYITQLLSMTQGRVMTLLKVISPISRSQCTHTQNERPGHNSSLSCWIWIIFHIVAIVVHDLWVYHDLDPRSCLQGQGHSAHKNKISVRAITRHCNFWSE